MAATLHWDEAVVPTVFLTSWPSKGCLPFQTQDGGEENSGAAALCLRHQDFSQEGGDVIAPQCSILQKILDTVLSLGNFGTVSLSQPVFTNWRRGRPWMLSCVSWRTGRETMQQAGYAYQAKHCSLDPLRTSGASTCQHLWDSEAGGGHS